jgi:ABC-type glycerol-3-phosphate transport system substrate-binding protein
MRMTAAFLSAATIFAGCGTESASPDHTTVVLTGVTQVLLAGTRSETVVLEVTETGEYFALVGDLARELVPLYGSEVAVTGVYTDEGWSVREELRKVLVLDYTVLGEPELP